MKPIVALLLSFLLPVSLLACSRNASQTDGTTVTVPLTSSPAAEIVHPMTRAGNVSRSSNSYNNKYVNLYALWNAADAVVRVRIGNWLMQSDFHSYYQAQTLECYKGGSPGTFVLQQIGASKYSYENLPLFTYGNELLLFLEKVDADAALEEPEESNFKMGLQSTLIPSASQADANNGEIYVQYYSSIIDLGPASTILPYDEYYRILDGGALMDTVLMSDGEVYLLDRYNIALYTPGMQSVTLADEELEEVVSILSRRDPYTWALFETDRFYRMSQLLERCE